MPENTLPLIRNGQRLSRRFLGRVTGKLDAVERAELKSYLKGQTLFAYKRDEQCNQMYFKVRQQYFYV